MKKKDCYPPNYDELFLKRALSKIVEKTQNECWLTNHNNTYHIISYKNKSVRTARAIYEILKTKIPQDNCLDCLCRNKACINPAHWKHRHKNSPENYPSNYDDIFLENLVKKIEGNKGGCWLINQSLDEDGYCILSYKGKPCRAHRKIYELVKGNIPSFMVCDHLCNNRNCVNPDHIEIKTNKENIQRGISHNGTKTHCPQGHPYTEENTYRHKGGRHCRECRHISNKKFIPPNQDWQRKNKDKLHGYYLKQKEKKNEYSDSLESIVKENPDLFNALANDKFN